MINKECVPMIGRLYSYKSYNYVNRFDGTFIVRMIKIKASLTRRLACIKFVKGDRQNWDSMMRADKMFAYYEELHELDPIEEAVIEIDITNKNQKKMENECKY